MCPLASKWGISDGASCKPMGKHSFLHLPPPQPGGEGLKSAGLGRACHPGVLRPAAGTRAGTAALLDTSPRLRLWHHCMLWACLCCFMAFPGTEEPVLGIYGAVSRAAHLCPHYSCPALLCHHCLVVPILNAVPPNKAVALACSWLPFLLPRGSSLRPGICRCPREASSCLPGQAGRWAVCPQCGACLAPRI